MKRQLSIVALAALVTACSGVCSDPVRHSLVPYPPEVQAAADAEMAGGSCPVLSRFADDYGELRARIRAAR